MPTGATSKCGTVDVLYRHIKTLLFVLENQYDKEQIFAELGVPVSDTPKGVVLIAEYLKSSNTTVSVCASRSRRLQRRMASRTQPAWTTATHSTRLS